MEVEHRWVRLVKTLQRVEKIGKYITEDISAVSSAHTLTHTHFFWG